MSLTLILLYLMTAYMLGNNLPAEGASNEWLEFLPEEEYNKLP